MKLSVENAFNKIQEKCLSRANDAFHELDCIDIERYVNVAISIEQMKLNAMHFERAGRRGSTRHDEE